MSTTRSAESSAAIRQLNKTVRDRAETVRTTEYAALEEAIGRSASAPPGSNNDWAVTRRASSVETRDTSLGVQSSAEDSLDEDSAAVVEDVSSSTDVEAGTSSADVGAGASSADVGAGRLRPATANSGTSHPNSTAPYPNLTLTVPSTLTRHELVVQANVKLPYNNIQAKIHLAAKLLGQQVQINFEASDITNQDPSCSFSSIQLSPCF
jgi:hypothetical protein